MPNPETQLTLDDAVAEVLGVLMNNDLRQVPELDRYQAVTRQLNASLQDVALEWEWSYYSSTEDVGMVVPGQTTISLRSSIRPRIILDDAVRFVDSDGQARFWAYIVPRESLHKYSSASTGLRCAFTRSTLEFSRPFAFNNNDLRIHVPVMREPKMFRLPEQPEDPDEPLVTVDQDIREQLVDFDNPRLIVKRAAYLYAQTNPLWQPRVQTLEAIYKDAMYALVERDKRNTDTPYLNEWNLPIENSATASRQQTGRPTADWERWF
jgi:hypothetical protein